MARFGTTGTFLAVTMLVAAGLWASSADARQLPSWTWTRAIPKKDVVPDADTAKRVASAVMAQEIEVPYRKKDFIEATLKGGVWLVSFTPWDTREPELVPGPGEVVVETDCGFCIFVQISKADGRIRSIFHSR